MHSFLGRLRETLVNEGKHGWSELGVLKVLISTGFNLIHNTGAVVGVDGVLEKIHPRVFRYANAWEHGIPVS